MYLTELSRSPCPCDHLFLQDRESIETVLFGKLKRTRLTFRLIVLISFPLALIAVYHHLQEKHRGNGPQVGRAPISFCAPSTFGARLTLVCFTDRLARIPGSMAGRRPQDPRRGAFDQTQETARGRSRSAEAERRARSSGKSESRISRS